MPLVATLFSIPAIKSLATDTAPPYLLLMITTEAAPKTELTNPAVRRMILPWLTGNDERDARSLSRQFRSIGFSLPDWRQVIAEVKPSTPLFAGAVRLVQCVAGEFVVTEVSMANIEEAFAVRGFVKSGININPAQRTELQGAPRFDRLCGPMWDGNALRYEDTTANDRLSA
jgi:hypothetical protein